MLSRYERQQLEMIERQLEQDQPEFATAFRRMRLRSRLRDRLWSCSALTLFGVLLFLVGCVAHLPLIALIGAMTTLLGVQMCVGRR